MFFLLLIVVGWYHSHPNITVWPSHVDLRTQFNYQVMDKYFIGLIFAVFNVSKNHNSTHSYQMISFQAQQTRRSNELKLVNIPHSIVNMNDDSFKKNVINEITRLSESLFEENLQNGNESQESQDHILRLSNNLGIITFVIF